MITLDQQIECAKRELRRRTRELPKAIDARTMTVDQVDREINEMGAIIVSLEEMKQFKRS